MRYNRVMGMFASQVLMLGMHEFEPCELRLVLPQWLLHNSCETEGLLYSVQGSCWEIWEPRLHFGSCLLPVVDCRVKKSSLCSEIGAVSYVPGTLYTVDWQQYSLPLSPLLPANPPTLPPPFSTLCPSPHQHRSTHCPGLIITLLQDFPAMSWEPKVQLPYKAEPGQVPRKIEIER